MLRCLIFSLWGIVFRVQLSQGEGQGRTLSCSVFKYSFLKHKEYNFSLRYTTCLYYYVYSLRGNQDPAPRPGLLDHMIVLYLGVWGFVVVWLCLQHAEVPGPGIKPLPQL